MGESERPMKRPPWWQWPNILSLDAPIIAVIWQETFARAFDAPVSLPERAVLFLAVWCVYAADHVADGLRLGAPADATARHRFAFQHRIFLGALVLVAGLSALALLPALSLRVILIGTSLAGIVGLYFLWNHFAGEKLARQWAKEFVIGLVFAAGCALVPLLAAPEPARFLSVVLFALVCMANCLLIARLDRERDIHRGETSLAVCLTPHSRPARVIAAVAGFAALPLLPIWPPLAASLVLSALGLWCGVLVERRFGADPAAVWADVVLLSPVVFFALTSGM